MRYALCLVLLLGLGCTTLKDAQYAVQGYSVEVVVDAMGAAWANSRFVAVDAGGSAIVRVYTPHGLAFERTLFSGTGRQAWEIVITDDDVAIVAATWTDARASIGAHVAN